MVKQLNLIFKVLFGLYVLTFISCSDKDTNILDPEILETKYLWSIDALGSFIQPLHKEDSYFIFPTDFESRELFLLRLEEKSGDTIYSVKLLDFDDAPTFGMTHAYIENTEIHLVLNNSFYKIDLNSGLIKTTYSFPNYLWRSNIEDQFIYTCSFKEEPFGFYYAYFDKNIGEQKVIYEENLEEGQSALIGHAPMVCDDGLAFPLSMATASVAENYLMKVTEDSIIKVEIDFTDNWIGGPVFDDDENIYLYMVDKMIAYKKSDLSVQWELNTVKGGSGPHYQTDEKIYMLQSRTVASGNIMYIIDKITGDKKVVISPQSYSNIEQVGNYIYFIGSGEFLKFDMITEKFVSEREEVRPGFGHQPIFGISSNSKIVQDFKGWHCYPW